MRNKNIVEDGTATQFRSGYEAAIMGKKGGEASGKARRKKKAMQEVTKEILNMPLKAEELDNICDIKSFTSFKDKNITVQEAITIAIMQKALKGDYKAAAFLRDTAGEKAAEKVEVAYTEDKNIREIEEYIWKKKK